MGGYALLICRSQTEAIGLRRHLARLGVPGEVARPPRHERTESHNMKIGGEMFSQLKEYEEESFYKEHPNFYIYTFTFNSRLGSPSFTI